MLQLTGARPGRQAPGLPLAAGPRAARDTQAGSLSRPYMCRREVRCGTHGGPRECTSPTRCDQIGENPSKMVDIKYDAIVKRALRTRHGVLKVRLLLLFFVAGPHRLPRPVRRVLPGGECQQRGVGDAAHGPRPSDGLRRYLRGAVPARGRVLWGRRGPRHRPPGRFHHRRQARPTHHPRFRAATSTWTLGSHSGHCWRFKRTPEGQEPPSANTYLGSSRLRLQLRLQHCPRRLSGPRSHFRPNPQRHWRAIGLL